jgi:hypothetical protein
VTLSRSAFRDLTVPRCDFESFFNCLSAFFCRLKAARRLSSRRAIVRSTFCAAATLPAGGVCADELRFAAGLFELCARLAGRALLDFFLLAADPFEEARREFPDPPRRVLVEVLFAMVMPIR